MNSIEKALQQNKFGLFYGTRVLLPFVADILKAIINDEIIYDFSAMSDGAYYEKQEKFTEIYFFEHEDILADVSKYETIKLVVVDDEDDLFDFKNHKKISLNPIENHKLEITELGDDVIFIE